MRQIRWRSILYIVVLLYSCALVRVHTAQTHRSTQRVPMWRKTGNTLDEGLSGYNTENLTVNHNGQRA